MKAPGKCETPLMNFCLISSGDDIYLLPSSGRQRCGSDRLIKQAARVIQLSGTPGARTVHTCSRISRQGSRQPKIRVLRRKLDKLNYFSHFNTTNASLTNNCRACSLSEIEALSSWSAPPASNKCSNKYYFLSKKLFIVLYNKFSSVISLYS